MKSTNQQNGPTSTLLVPFHQRYRLMSLFLFLVLVLSSLVLLQYHHRRPMLGEAAAPSPPMKILFIVTSLSEYNDGSRGTVVGFDRFGNVLTPVLLDNVYSMVERGYVVDVMLILGFNLSLERQATLQAQLPHRTGLQVWNDATPLSRDLRKGEKFKKYGDNVFDNTMNLARQSRFVAKDKLPHYDFFAAFEDDMRVTGDHVAHFIDMMRQIEQMRVAAPDMHVSSRGDDNVFHGALSQTQLDHMIPGFIRAEVQSDPALVFPGYNHSTATDFVRPGLHNEEHFSAQSCCHVNEQLPVNWTVPTQFDGTQHVLVWETAITNWRVRELPNGEWVVLLPGPSISRSMDGQTVGGYYAGKTGEFGKDFRRPWTLDGRTFGQQAGWMLTQQQLLKLHRSVCPSGFLPPFDNATQRGWPHDGLLNNVEFWSGGFQLFGGGGASCSMQRFLSLQNAATFSKHFIFHVANNKHRTAPDKTRFVRADELWGQANHVRKHAILAKMDDNNETVALSS